LANARCGAITVFAAFMIVVMLAAAAFAIDMGMLCMAKTELQRTADASALAATDELLDQLCRQPGKPGDVVHRQQFVIQEAAVFTAQANKVFSEAPKLWLNPANDSAGEIVIGEMTRTADGAAALSLDDPTRFNSVAITVKRTSAHNGNVPLFFGRVLGLQSVAAEAQAQAAFQHRFNGFRVPTGGDDPPPTLRMFPFAIERTAWDKAVSGAGPDDYRWNKDDERVEQGRGDGIQEINLYPLDTNAGGNFGTIDIGGDKSSNDTLARQIVEGLSRSDLDYHGGQLALDANGQLILSGDPGMKVGAILPAVSKIIGQTRIVPLYSSVRGNGQYTEFTITAFGACRVLDIELHGGDKNLTVQPASMITRGGIPGTSGKSSQIYSPIVLVR
jgi:hypothetical protein